MSLVHLFLSHSVTSEVLQGSGGALVLAVVQKVPWGLLGKEHEDEVGDERKDVEAGQPAPGGNHRAQPEGAQRSEDRHPVTRGGWSGIQ